MYQMQFYVFVLIYLLLFHDHGLTRYLRYKSIIVLRTVYSADITSPRNAQSYFGTVLAANNQDRMYPYEVMCNKINERLRKFMSPITMEYSKAIEHYLPRSASGLPFFFQNFR